MSALAVVTIATSSLELAILQCELIRQHGPLDADIVVGVDTPANSSPTSLWDAGLRTRLVGELPAWADVVLEVPPEVHAHRRLLFPQTPDKVARNASQRHADSMQWLFNWCLESRYSQLVMVDGDLFPLRPFSADSLRDTKPIAGVRQVRARRVRPVEVVYLWPGLLAIDVSSVLAVGPLNFDVGKISGARVDTGGRLNAWIRSANEVGLGPRWLEILQSKEWTLDEMPTWIPEKLVSLIINDDRNVGGNFFSEIVADNFFHLRSSSNWRNEDENVAQNRINCLIDALR